MEQQLPLVYDETLDHSYQPFENPDESSEFSCETPQKHNESSDQEVDYTTDSDDESIDYINENSFFPLTYENPEDYEINENTSQTSQEDDSEPYDDEYSESRDYESSDAELYNSFESVYRCFPLSCIAKTHLECGDKIIMPVEALRRLLETRIDYPMLFEIHNQTTGKVSHCGVYEFTGEEDSVCLPNWMMENLQLQEGDSVNMKNASLEKGTYMKLQPHTMDFMGIRNMKAVLQERFRGFSCLTIGDTIMISHEGKNFYVNIVETKPSDAICIIDIDCEVDIVRPLNYKEPEKPAPKNALPKDPAIEQPKFIPFSGVARRLDGKPLAAPIASSAQNEVPSVAADGRRKASELKFTLQKCPANVVLSSDDTQPQNNSKKPAKEDVKAESSKNENRFQPFIGKKYSLTD